MEFENFNCRAIINLLVLFSNLSPLYIIHTIYKPYTHIYQPLHIHKHQTFIHQKAQLQISPKSSQPKTHTQSISPTTLPPFLPLTFNSTNQKPPPSSLAAAVLLLCDCTPAYLRYLLSGSHIFLFSYRLAACFLTSPSFATCPLLLFIFFIVVHFAATHRGLSPIEDNFRLMRSFSLPSPPSALACLIHNTQLMFALVGKACSHSSYSHIDFLPKITPLQNELSGITLTTLPYELPPMQDNQYAIDLFPDS